jgi:hypothetical protein
VGRKANPKAKPPGHIPSSFPEPAILEDGGHDLRPLIVGGEGGVIGGSHREQLTDEPLDSEIEIPVREVLMPPVRDLESDWFSFTAEDTGASFDPSARGGPGASN